jgi:hypothetical protein
MEQVCQVQAIVHILLHIQTFGLAQILHTHLTGTMACAQHTP